MKYQGEKNEEAKASIAAIRYNQKKSDRAKNKKESGSKTVKEAFKRAYGYYPPSLREVEKAKKEYKQVAGVNNKFLNTFKKKNNDFKTFLIFAQALNIKI